MLYRDGRLAGEPIVTLGEPKDWGMRIPDVVKDCVGFFFVYGAGPGPANVAHHGGTGFFASIRGRDSTTMHMYLVTAKHVALKAPQAGDGRVFIRYTSSAEGLGVEPVEIASDKWKLHDDPSVDVAVMHFDSYTSSGKDRFKLPRPITFNAYLTGEVASKYSIGIGDELSVVGLFQQRPGIKQNAPIVRHGIISAMPGEPIQTVDEHGVEVPPFAAYLAEIRSIRGLSGSPVFVNLAVGRNQDGTYDSRGSPLLLLGLIRGHFYIPRKPSKHELTEGELELKEINSGISMVTPISYVADILKSEDFVKERDEIERKAAHAAGGRVTSDAGFGPKSDDTERRGPEPERLAIDLPMDEAVRKMFEAGKPPKE